MSSPVKRSKMERYHPREPFNALVAQLVDATSLSLVSCRFESGSGYQCFHNIKALCILGKDDM
jgi:hypothetical protein